MELTPLLVGAVAGMALAYVLFYILHKSTSVRKQDFDAQVAKLNSPKR